jgi:hypothetical protein
MKHPVKGLREYNFYERGDKPRHFYATLDISASFSHLVGQQIRSSCLERIINISKVL